MITGFGNNVISSLAADITAGQTTIQVMPGTGAKFAGLLSSDYANASNPLQTYAKITLTDAKETVFEICHLTSVNNDVLTVVRGQEGTTAKGWALNDVIANFATRGSENQFVQIEQLQSGHYISGVAGGTANALTLELPATYFVNGSTNWTLRTPIVVYPTQNNTGASTLQLTMGGRVLGTFKLYKGNKAELVASDILKDTGLVCLLDNTKTFFNVMNPGAIYAGLGTAAFHDVQTSKDDVTLGRVLVNGGALALRTVAASGGGGAYTDDCNNLPANSVSFVYGSAKNSPGFEASVLDFSGLGGQYRTQIAASYSDGGKRISIRTCNADIQTWNAWKPIITADGGSVDYLANARFYSTRQGVWQGGGAFANQLTDPTAPFYVPTFTAPNDTSVYLPICKGSSQIDGRGYVSAVSFGALRSGGLDFGSAIIQIIGDSGKGAILSFSADGDLNVPHQVNGVNIVASGGVFESGGNVRVYSLNNPPPDYAPAGIPLPWPTENVPAGWMFCVGQAFNTSQYPQLAAAYPAGYIPDMRGVFIRGLDAYRGIDPGRGILSLQYGQAPASGLQRGPWGNYAQVNRGISVMIGTDNDGYPNVTQESESQRETRPINVAFNFIVRAA